MKTLISTLTLFMICLISMASEIVLIPEINYKIDLPENWRIEKVNNSSVKIVYSKNRSIFLLVKWEKIESTKSDSITYITTTKSYTTNKKSTSKKMLNASTSSGVKYENTESTEQSFNYNKSFFKNGYSIIINCDIDSIDDLTKKELDTVIKKIGDK
jgi:hypothetical protein